MIGLPFGLAGDVVLVAGCDRVVSFPILGRWNRLAERADH